MAEVLVHDDADVVHVFFELPQNLVDRIYSYGPDDTLASNLQKILDWADRYEDLLS